MRARDAESGFTIAEVLVAFAVASLGALLALEIAGSTTSGVRRLESARASLDEAEGVALRRIAAGPLGPGLTQGRFSDGTAWTLRVTDARPALGNPRLPPLWQIQVEQGAGERGGGEPLYTTLVAGGRDG